MVVILTKDDYVDFEAPIFMMEHQFEKFHQGLEKIFGKVDVHEVIELEKDMSDVLRHPQKWTPEQLVYLTLDKSHEEIAYLIEKELGIKREPFSIRSKRGVWLKQFLTWARRKGYIRKGRLVESKKAIKEYEDSKN